MRISRFGDHRMPEQRSRAWLGLEFATKTRGLALAMGLARSWRPFLLWARWP